MLGLDDYIQREYKYFEIFSGLTSIFKIGGYFSNNPILTVLADTTSQNK